MMPGQLGLSPIRSVIAASSCAAFSLVLPMDSVITHQCPISLQLDDPDIAAWAVTGPGASAVFLARPLSIWSHPAPTGVGWW
ncbi:MAG: hypothetical protein QOH35_5985 [Acidobacteriaceae bacterium]|nr:hypothetical protein [Acidobacteriaceae bacterium]